MYFQGVSTRQVRKVLDAMCGGEISATTVSQVAAELDEKLSAFRQRRLDDQSYPYLMIDARYEKVRVGSQVVSQAVLVTMGITGQGRREILDWRVADSESADNWSELFASLKARGLSGVKLVTSDAHEGIRKAMARHFQGVAWQRCKVHYKRELARKVSHQRMKEALKDLAVVFGSADKSACLRLGEEMALKWEGEYPSVSKMLREGLEDCLSVLSLPENHRRKLSSTNLLENLMKQLRRRTAVVGVFPSRSSCDRLVGARLLEIHERWLVEERPYINMENAPATWMAREPSASASGA
jgi:putative transposase